jgi:dTDP-4-dehydrorhamnose 3,5-epimerase
VQIRELSVPGALEITPVVHGDARGSFHEWFKAEAFAAVTGHSLRLSQANCSVSARGTLRGIHFADVPPGQAKYVTCASGAVLDIVVDIRVGSPTFGQVDSVLLDTVDKRAIYLAEGLGHAFISLADASTVLYLCSTGYAPGREHGINPMDPALTLPIPAGLEVILSDKDRDAPTLAEAAASGLLPRWEDCVSYVSTLHP